jgi:hypothetical protein
MRVSIVIPVLDSHEIVRRQCLHFERIGLPDMSDVEWVLVDDGSDQPIKAPDWVRVVRTNDKRPWTWAVARNAGARAADGEVYVMTDIDHIIDKPLIDAALEFTGQKMQFERQFGVLDENGVLTQDHEVLIKYGLPRERVEEQGARCKPLTNNFAMRRDIFWELGGYREDLIGREYPAGEDRKFRSAWRTWEEKGKGKVDPRRPVIYMFPNGQFCGDIDYNPFNLFHTLSRKSDRNHLWRRQKKREGLECDNTSQK